MAGNVVAKAKHRFKMKGRRESGSFAALPHQVMDSDNWRHCSATAIKMLCELMRQFNGKNNGDLCATKSVLKPRGWKSSDTITWALRELQHYGLIVLTKQGTMEKPNLYALTWRAIDECNGKLDVPATRTAPGDWKTERPRFKRPSKKRSATPVDGLPSHRMAEHLAA